MLNEQYRMHPMISHFPRTIFYGGLLKDGPNVKEVEYGNPLIKIVRSQAPQLQVSHFKVMLLMRCIDQVLTLSYCPNLKPFSVLDLDSKEERGGTSLSNSTEAHLVVHMYTSLREMTNSNKGIMGRVAVVTPYSQQANLLRRLFRNLLGPQYTNSVEVNSVDGFQGRESNIVIFSAVRAAGSHGIGFLSDVRRMNVALTRAKHFLFVIAHCDSIVVNPYWNQLIEHAKGQNAVLKVPSFENDRQGSSGQKPWFGNVKDWKQDGCTTASVPSDVSGSITTATKPSDPRKTTASGGTDKVKKPSDPRKSKVSDSAGVTKKPSDPRKTVVPSGIKAPKKPSDPRKRKRA